MDVILVDEQDNKIGTQEKIRAHKEGNLHRAFSIFIFNSKKELLLQKRSMIKYHSVGLWSNTCCSHPVPEKTIEKYAKQRLIEEMGFTCDIKEIFSFKYNEKIDKGLIEHEYDHVFIGYYDREPVPNPDEVMDYRWISFEKLEKKLKQNPEKYTIWVKLCLDKVKEYINSI